MREIIGVAGVAAASDYLPLADAFTRLNVGTVVGQMCIQRVCAVVMPNDDVIIKTPVGNLTVAVHSSTSATCPDRIAIIEVPIGMSKS